MNWKRIGKICDTGLDVVSKISEFLMHSYCWFFTIAVSAGLLFNQIEIVIVE